MNKLVNSPFRVLEFDGQYDVVMDEPQPNAVDEQGILLFCSIPEEVALSLLFRLNAALLHYLRATKMVPPEQVAPDELKKLAQMASKANPFTERIESDIPSDHYNARVVQNAEFFNECVRLVPLMVSELLERKKEDVYG